MPEEGASGTLSEAARNQDDDTHRIDSAPRNMAGRAWWIAPTRTASIIGSPVKIVAEKSIPTSVRWLLLLFVFSMPFEMYPSRFTSGSLSLAKIAGALFITVYLTHYNPFSRTRSLPRFPRALWWFAGYLTVFAMNGFFFSRDSLTVFFPRFLTMAQLMVFFWIASDLLRDEGLARKAFLTYAVATLAVALGMLVGLTGLSVTYKSRVGARMSSMGFNPNTLSVLLVLAALILMGLYLIAPPLRLQEGLARSLGRASPSGSCQHRLPQRNRDLRLRIPGLSAALAPLSRQADRADPGHAGIAAVGLLHFPEFDDTHSL